MSERGPTDSPRSTNETRESPHITLFVIEKGEQSGEHVGDGRWAVVVFEDLKHFETPVIIRCTGILEEELSVPPFLQCSPDLALPELAGKGVPRVRNKG